MKVLEPGSRHLLRCFDLVWIGRSTPSLPRALSSPSPAKHLAQLRRLVLGDLWGVRAWDARLVFSAKPDTGRLAWKLVSSRVSGTLFSLFRMEFWQSGEINPVPSASKVQLNLRQPQAIQKLVSLRLPRRPRVPTWKQGVSSLHSLLTKLLVAVWALPNTLRMIIFTVIVAVRSLRDKMQSWPTALRAAKSPKLSKN